MRREYFPWNKGTNQADRDVFLVRKKKEKKETCSHMRGIQEVLNSRP